MLTARREGEGERESEPQIVRAMTKRDVITYKYRSIHTSHDLCWFGVSLALHLCTRITFRLSFSRSSDQFRLRLLPPDKYALHAGKTRANSIGNASFAQMHMGRDFLVWFRLKFAAKNEMTVELMRFRTYRYSILMHHLGQR